MSKHVCVCANCDPGLEPVGDREGAHHVGVRFGTNVPAAEWIFRLNGEEMPNVVEAVAGKKGRIFQFVPCTEVPTEQFPENVGDKPKGPHRCQNCQAGVCARWLFGHVEIVKDGAVIAAPEEKVHA